MVILLVVLGIILIIAGMFWLFVFNIRKRDIIEKYANSSLLEYTDEDIVPEEVAKKFILDGIRTIFSKILLNTLLPSIVILCGMLAIVIASYFGK